MHGPRRLLPALVVAGVLLAGCAAPVPDASRGPDSTGAIDGDVFQLGVGDCLDDRDVADEVTTVPVVPCSGPHDSEVFARTEAADGPFPGMEALETQLAEFCQGAVFEEFVGIPYAESRYVTGGYFPTAGSWASGDRELLCTVYDDDAPTTGSLEGAERSP